MFRHAAVTTIEDDHYIGSDLLGAVYLFNGKDCAETRVDRA